MREKIRVTYRADPFDFEAVKSFEVDPGMTLADIVKEVTDDPDFFFVTVNGWPVEREWLKRIKPKARGKNDWPVIVALQPVPFGDDAKTFLGIAVAVAAVAAATFLLSPAGGTFVAGLTGLTGTALTVATSTTAAAVGVASSLAINALTAPPIAANLEADSGPQQKTIAGVSGNTIAAGDYLPMILGKLRTSPPPLMPSYTSFENGDVYINGIVGLAGAYLIENIWLNGSPATLFDDFQFDFRNGLASDAAPSLAFTYSVQEVLPRLKLSQSKRLANSQNMEPTFEDNFADYHIFNLAPPGDTGKIIVRLFWPGGMNHLDPGNNINAGGIGIRVEIRPRSSSAWFNLPELHFHQNAVHSGEIRQQIVLQWQGSAPSGNYVVDANATAWMAFGVASQGNPFEYQANAAYQQGGAIDLCKGVTQDDDGFIVQIDNSVMDGDEEYDIRVKISNAYAEASFNANYVYGGSGPRGDEIFAYRTASGTTSAKAASPGEMAYVESVSSWIARDPFDWHGLASISFKAKGIQIESLSADFTSMVPVWDGASWANVQPTQNPAALYRFVCLTPDYNSRALPGEILDEDSILDWFIHCQTKEYECNAIVQNQSLPSVLQLCAAAGWASPRFSEKWGVVIERDQSGEQIIQMLTPMNSKDLGTVREFPQMPHAIRAEYFSDEQDFNLTDDIVAYAPGFDIETATIYESIRYDGITDPVKVQERAQFDIDQLYLRATRYVRDVHHEGFLSPRGSLIGLTDEVVERTQRYSIIKSVQTSGGNVTGLTLETIVDLEEARNAQEHIADPDASSQNPLGITVRLNDGTPSTHLITETAATDVVTFATPVANTGQFEANQIVALGVAGVEYRRCLVMTVEPHQGGEMFRLTLADERPELHA